MKASSAGLREIKAVRLEGPHFDRDDQDVQEAKSLLRRKLAKASQATIVPIDLGGAQLTSSCLAEILGPALEGIVRGEYEERYVVVVDPDGKYGFELDAALEKETDIRGEKLVCVRRSDEIHLAGPVDSQVERTYNFVRQHWAGPHGATARAYVKVERDRVSIQAAGNRLTKAAKLGLIHAAERLPVSGGGSQWRYVPIE